VTHTYLCPMRWGDLDAQGHINNAAYLDYLQEGRVDFLVSGPEVMQALLQTGVLVVSHQVEYLRPIQFSPEPLRIDLWVDAMGASRFSIGYDVFDHGELAARARTGAVPFDLATASLRRLSPGERAALTVELSAAEPLPALARVRWTEQGHRHPLVVRWSDLDLYGHVNNVKYYDYLQEVVTVVVRIGRRSFTLAAEIRDPERGTVFATARTVVVGTEPLSTAARSALSRWALPH